MPVRTTHPLLGHQEWAFFQPNLGFRAHYVAASPSGERETRSVQVMTTCREGIIHSLRTSFQNNLTDAANLASRGGWKGSPKILKSVDLTDPQGKIKPTALRIQWHPHWMVGWEDFPVEKFVQVCNVVMGPVMVLLGVHRPIGKDWWRTDPGTCMETILVPESEEHKYVHWYGSDNWFLAHPVTVSIATGLYRQCFQLCAVPGLADEIVSSLEREEVDEVMSTNSQRLALQLIKRTRSYIEVPAGRNGYRVNYPFALGFWRRLMRLQRAAHRVSYAEIFGQDFNEGWSLTGSKATNESGEWSGVYKFWGEEGELTGKHRLLMKLGAPRRKGSVEPDADRTS